MPRPRQHLQQFTLMIMPVTGLWALHTASSSKPSMTWLAYSALSPAPGGGLVSSSTLFSRIECCSSQWRLQLVDSRSLTSKGQCCRPQPGLRLSTNCNRHWDEQHSILEKRVELLTRPPAGAGLKAGACNIALLRSDLSKSETNFLLSRAE